MKIRFAPVPAPARRTCRARPTCPARLEIAIDRDTDVVAVAREKQLF